MSGKKRARVGKELDETEDVDDEMEEGSEEDDDMEEDENAPNEVIQFDFEGRSPEDIHSDGIQRLLHQLFLKLDVNVLDLTDWIIRHNRVGVVLQQLDLSDDDDDDDDSEICVMGVTTVADITEGQKSEFSKQLKTLLLNQCQLCSAKQSKKLEEILNDESHRVAFLINERILGINAPMESFQSLWKDIEREKKDPKYAFSYYVLLSKTFFPLKSSEKNESDEKIFCNAEDELFFRNSLLSFDFSVADQLAAVTDDDSKAYQAFRTVMVIAADKISQIMSEMPGWLQSHN